MAMDSDASDWGGCLNLEPDLLEVDIRSRSFLPKDSWSVIHRNPSWTSSKLVLEKENPFSTMNISSTYILEKQGFTVNRTIMQTWVCSF